MGIMEGKHGFMEEVISHVEFAAQLLSNKKYAVGVHTGVLNAKNKTHPFHKDEKKNIF